MEIFNKRLHEYIKGLDVKKQTKYTIDNNTYQKIQLVLQHQDIPVSPKFKFWAKQTFILVQIGLNHFVYNKQLNLPLITFEHLYEKISECHAVVGHSGRDKTWNEIKRKYSGIPIKAVSMFLKMCDTCQTRRSVPKLCASKSIVSVGFMTRLQMDLIDMRSVSYNGFTFILHIKDHFTKFSWLSALPSKEAKHVAEQLRLLFYTFGPPRILQSDNGKEFVAGVILDLKKTWPELLIINGRARHPQSQGLIERSNAVVQQMLGKWQDVNKTDDWPSGLGSVMFSINSSVSQNTKKTPYEMVFGQSPRHDEVFWKEVFEQAANQSETLNNTVDEETISHLMDDHEQIDNSSSKRITTTDQLDQSSSFRLDQNNEESLTNHQRIRAEAEIVYLNAAARQNKNYERIQNRQKIYEIGDIVGIKIANVDRSNTAPSIMPVKIVEKRSCETESKLSFIVATEIGIINCSYSRGDLIDLTETVAYNLRQLDTNNLQSISVIQASHHFTKFRTVSACKCIGTCSTNRCPCKKKSIACCSKCHRGKKVTCDNC